MTVGRICSGGKNSLELCFDDSLQLLGHCGDLFRSSIEPRGCVVWIDEQDTLQVVTTNKTPFSLRDHLASVSGLPSDRVIVDSRFIGGDFGGKGSSIEEFSCYFLLIRGSRRRLTPQLPERHRKQGSQDQIDDRKPQHRGMIKHRHYDGYTRDHDRPTP